jgi:hypothetical protein
MAKDELIGQTIAGYRLLQHVGEGGTATVYKANMPRTDCGSRGVPSAWRRIQSR